MEKQFSIELNQKNERMYNPLISIIVPVYNVEQYLNECVQSLIAQTYSNIEIILVDDGSLDDCPRLCDEWKDKDSRVLVLHINNGGLSHARNVGIDSSSGDYIMFVDSDDFVDGHMVEKLLIALRKFNADISCCSYYRKSLNNCKAVVNSITSRCETFFTGMNALRHMLNRELECSSWNRLYSREVIGNIRFINGRYNEDVIFLFYLYQKCRRVVYINEPLYYYRLREGSVTSKISDKTMHSLVNCLEMERFAIENKMEIQEEFKNYKCRVCLEIAYLIQKEKVKKEYFEEAVYSRNHTRSNMFYILTSKYYSWKDAIHALIVLLCM